MITQELLKIVEDTFDIQHEFILLDDRLDKHFDLLDVICLSIQLENKTGIFFENEEVARWVTFEDVIISVNKFGD